MMKNLLYYLLYGFAYLISLLPFKVLYGLSDCIWFLMYRVVKYRRKVVWKNLKASFPEKDDIELSRIEYEFYQWLCDYIVETIKLLSISDKELLKHIEFQNVEEVKEALKANQPHDHYILIKGSNSVKLFQLPELL